MTKAGPVYKPKPHGIEGGAKSNGRLVPASDLLDEIATASPVGRIVQDFSPIHQSLDWRLSAMFWRGSGLASFTSGEIPYVATNDGAQAGNAVATYRASLRAAEAAGTREPLSYVLELGSGSGLFAKLFLDQLADAAAADGSDDYDRTVYLVSDGSPVMLDDTRESGVLDRHEARVRRILLAAPDIRGALADGLPGGEHPFGAIRAVHANYVLDSLPLTVLLLIGARLGEMRLRSHLDLAPGVWEEACELIERFLASPDSLHEDDRRKLQELHDHIALEARYIACDREDLPVAGAVPEIFGHEEDARLFLHSFGALQCLEQAHEALIDGGYIIVQDYGFTGSDTQPDAIEFQQFGGAVACGLNFSQIEALFSGRPGSSFVSPEADPESLHARLIGKNVAPEVPTLFRSLYSAEAWAWQTELFDEGRALAEDGQNEAARWKFAEAYRRLPYNWAQVENYASFLIYTAEDYDGALRVLRRCLDLNHLSGNLWNMLGDCYFYREDLDAAAESYQRAIELNPRDIQGRINLADVAQQRGEYREGLVLLAEALGINAGDDCAEAILSKQSEILGEMTENHARRTAHTLNRLSGHRDLRIRDLQD